MCFLPLIAALLEVSQENKGGVAVYLDPCFPVMLLVFFVCWLLMNFAKVYAIIKINWFYDLAINSNLYMGTVI